MKNAPAIESLGKSFMLAIALAFACMIYSPEILHAQGEYEHAFASFELPVLTTAATTESALFGTSAESETPESEATTLSHDHEGLDGDHDDDDDDDHHGIACQKYTDLDFGGGCAGLISGTIVMSANPSTTRTSTGGVLLDSRNPGHPAMVKLTIYNDNHCKNDDHRSNDDDECDRDEDDDNHHDDHHSTFQRHGTTTSIGVPSSSTLTLTLGGHQYSMSATDFTINRTNGTVYIGATLHVGANQPAGVYHGSFSLTQICQ